MTKNEELIAEIQELVDVLNSGISLNIHPSSQKAEKLRTVLHKFKEKK